MQMLKQNLKHNEKQKEEALSIFSLPKNVRMLIYEYAAIYQSCTTWVEHENHWKGHVRNYVQEGRRLSVQDSMREEDSAYICRRRPLPINLLQVSKAIRNEVAPHLIGKNNFAAVLASRTGLDCFFDCFWSNFEHLRNLHIDLRPRDQRNLRTGISRNGGVHRTIWNMWPEFCQAVREQMPNLRAFSLKCRVKDPEVARRLLDVMKNFPRLQECAVHFNHLPLEDIQPQVKAICEHLTRPAHQKAFPFMKLPHEIQLQILENALSDRSDPFAYTAGNAPSVGLPSVRSVVSLQRPCDMRVLQENPLVCCGTCSPVKTRCFCMARQTSYSTTCTCYASPVSYFLVSHAFYRIAAEVFFSSNTFLLIDEDPFSFLRIMNSISNENLKHIRDLALQFPRVSRVPTRPAHRPNITALQSWSILRRFIRDHFDINRLSLSIIDLGMMPNVSHTPLTRIQYVRRLLRAFVDIPDLYDFWVYLADDEVFEHEARRLVLGERVISQPPLFIRDYAELGDIRN